jgi:serine/threonine protein kinase
MSGSGSGDTNDLETGDQHDPMIGAWILGQYRIVRVLASGGMGKVYLAEQTAMDRYAAIKFVKATKTEEEIWRERFRREARAASRLVHPNIVTVFNFGEVADGSLFLAMEHVLGVSIRAMVKQGPLPLDRAVELARQCAGALGHAHSKGVIHRDFKPENVVVTELEGRDHVKVLDFGVARLVERETVTQTGAVVGSPPYMSPEQGEGKISPLSDQYALGLVLYEMLTGQRAYTADTVIGYLLAHQNQIPVPPSRLRPEAGIELVEPIVARLLAKAAEDRFTDMEQVQQELQRLCRELPPSSGAGPGGEAPIALARRFADVAGGRDVVPTADSPLIAAGSAPSTAQHLPRPPASRLWHTGSTEIFTESGWDSLGGSGFELRRGDEDPARQVESSDLWVLSVADHQWELAWERLASRGARASRTLVCINASLDTPGLGELSALFPNLVVGPYPLDPSVVCTALSWLRRNEGGGIDTLISEGAVQLVQIRSSAQKSTYVDTLLEDARMQGIRQWMLTALGELSEEMIMNAVFHAPVDHRGEHRFSLLDRADELTLKPGDEPTLRWSFSERFMAISIGDPFGSLSAEEVLARITGPDYSPDLERAPSGVGTGLRIMSRAGRHLIFAICPGAWCEVLALVPRRASKAQSLCVLQGLGSTTRRLGDRLRLNERRRNGVPLLELEGEINETSDLGAVFARSGAVHLDLSQVTRINSAGIRAWLDAALARDDGLEISFERCSYALVSQLNMHPELTEGVRVASITAPYYCPNCRLEVAEVLQVEALAASQLDRSGEIEAPCHKCPECNCELQFEALPEEYFAFLTE